MRLPYLPKKFKKSEIATLAFLGINLTDNYQEGEFDDTKNLSSLSYPTLTQRKGRTLIEDYDDVTDVYSWGDKLVVVSNGVLYVDGEAITNVNTERKQFAVVNTKLIVHPDMICVDLKNEKKTDMKAAFTSKALEDAVIFSSDKITCTLDTRENEKAIAEKYSGQYWTPYTYTYGTDVEAFLECWDADNKLWDFERLAELQEESTLCGFHEHGIEDLPANSIIIPSMTENDGIKTFRIVKGDAYGSLEPVDTSQYNEVGFYAIVNLDDDFDNYTSSGHYFQYRWLYDVYDADTTAPLLDEVFEDGDVLDISGTPFKLFDTTIDDTDEEATTVSKLKIKNLDCDSTTRINNIIVEDGTYTIPVYARKHAGAATPTGSIGIYMRYKQSGSSYYYLTIPIRRTFGKNTAFLIYGDYVSGGTVTVKEWNYVKRKFVAEYTGTWTTDMPSASLYGDTGYIMYTFQSYVDDCTITFQRAVPDLAYICERDNRLWGVSNTDGTIYASSLGIPWIFYDYSGLDTDSYAVAVGSGGDFTGIVNYNGVLCFKEDRVHKMLGNYPSEFYMTTYEVPGIQQGAHLSAKTISEVLYYKSPVGVVNFTGYQPSNISSALKFENTLTGIGCSDGKEYYLCTKSKDGSKYSLFKYDLTTRIWLKEEDAEVHTMTCHQGKIYIGITTRTTAEDESGETVEKVTRKLYLTGQENGEEVEWSARFKPFISDVVSDSTRYKVSGLARMVIRLEMDKGSYLKIKVRYDSGAWETMWTQPAPVRTVRTVPIRIARCDKFEIELEGRGNVRINSIKREVILDGKLNDVY